MVTFSSSYEQNRLIPTGTLRLDKQSARLELMLRLFWDVKQAKTKQHLVDVELRLAPGHFSVAGAELADEVVAAGTKGNGLN